MSGKRPGWRAAERTYNALTRDLRRRAADSVCPDGAACPEDKCKRARAAILAGKPWAVAFSIVHDSPAPEGATVADGLNLNPQGRDE